MTAQVEIPRWKPKDSREVAHRLAVCYVYDFEAGPRKVPTFAVVAYTTRAKKACFHESYRNAESRDKRVTDWFRGLEQHEAMKQDTRAERSKPHTLKVGDILHHSWGWEQTNCDYYQIIAVTPHGATIQEIASHTVPDSTYKHGMADMRLAVKDSFCGDPFKVRINGFNHVAAGDGPLSHGSCGIWDGKANYCSWYA